MKGRKGDRKHIRLQVSVNRMFLSKRVESTPESGRQIQDAREDEGSIQRRCRLVHSVLQGFYCTTRRSVLGTKRGTRINKLNQWRDSEPSVTSQYLLLTDSCHIVHPRIHTRV